MSKDSGETSVYSIIGSTTSPDNPEKQTTFAGYFQFSTRTSDTKEGRIRGLLIDVSGASEIKGKMSPERLTFERRNPTTGEVHKYELEGSTISWRGTYSESPGGKQLGTVSVQTNWYEAKTRSENKRDKSRLVDELIEEGKII